MRVFLQFRGCPRPCFIRISSENGQGFHFVERCGSPCGGGVERDGKAALLGEFAQGVHMRAPLFMVRLGVGAVFVFDLYADDRSAVAPQQTLDFLCQFPIPSADIGEIGRVIGAGFEAILKANPIRKPAVAAFSVTPRTDPQQDRQLQFAAKLRKSPQVALPGEIPHALCFFMVNPEDVGCNQRDAACFHFAKFPLPVLPAIAGKLKLARNGKPRLAVSRQIAAVDRNRVSCRSASAKRKVCNGLGLPW